MRFQLIQYQRYLNFAHKLPLNYVSHLTGLETMYRLLHNGKSYKLRVDLKLFNGETGYSQYDIFSLGPETDAYRIHIAGYSGTTGMTNYVIKICKQLGYN